MLACSKNTYLALLLKRLSRVFGGHQSVSGSYSGALGSRMKLAGSRALATDCLASSRREAEESFSCASLGRRVCQACWPAFLISSCPDSTVQSQTCCSDVSPCIFRGGSWRPFWRFLFTSRQRCYRRGRAASATSTMPLFISSASRRGPLDQLRPVLQFFLARPQTPRPKFTTITPGPSSSCPPRTASPCTLCCETGERKPADTSYGSSPRASLHWWQCAVEADWAGDWCWSHATWYSLGQPAAGVHPLCSHSHLGMPADF